MDYISRIFGQIDWISAGVPVLFLIIFGVISMMSNKYNLGGEVMKIETSSRQKGYHLLVSVFLLGVVLIPPLWVENGNLFGHAGVSLMVVAIVSLELFKMVVSFFRPLVIGDKGILIGYNFYDFNSIQQIRYSDELVEVYFHRKKKPKNIHVIDGEQLRYLKMDEVEVQPIRESLESMY